MTASQPASWLGRDLPVLRAVEQLDLTEESTHDLTRVVERCGLPPADVSEALEVLQTLSALRLEQVGGQAPRVGRVTAIGSAMLAIQAESDLAS
ncbi:hypothetical protein [Arsenicicoccus sp. oral taxon 190]|uniref:hypothetical protein n=1 Tax=Arsenicicoccus sp. oral taxon 190 TaxID=1658671 RepID=UPI000679F88B|nr:hypothetical protein [Arsenicicoccus sp. oral taxon 190]AKT51781.1 hypothetical protein ADJ73_11690 [Arsenicicoccus sp. oral taxon 190]